MIYKLMGCLSYLFIDWISWNLKNIKVCSPATEVILTPSELMPNKAREPVSMCLPLKTLNDT